MSSNGFIPYFRSGVRFSERFAKNIIIHAKWIFNKSKKLHGWLMSLHNPPKPKILPYAYGLVIGVIIIALIIPAFIWTIFKSI